MTIILEVVCRGLRAGALVVENSRGAAEIGRGADVELKRAGIADVVSAGGNTRG